jgi:hypothetical protein
MARDREENSSSDDENSRGGGFLVLESIVDHCPPASVRGLFWNWTRGGDTAIQPCPGGSSGFAKWHCGGGGGGGGISANEEQTASWSTGAPDLSECESHWLTRLKARLRDNMGDGSDESVDLEEDVATELAEQCRARVLYGGDVARVADLMQALVHRVRRQQQQQQQQQQQHQVEVERRATELSRRLMEAGSHLLADGPTAAAWADLVPAERAAAGSDLAAALTEAAALQADSLATEQTLAVRQANIVAAVRVMRTTALLADQRFRTTDEAVELVVAADSLSTSSVDGAVRLMFFYYHNLDHVLPSSTNGVKFLNSQVAGATLSRGGGHHHHLHLGETAMEQKNSRTRRAAVTATFRHIEETLVPAAAGGGAAACVWWDFVGRAWAETGCWVVAASSNRSHTVCQCDHLAAIMAVLTGDKDSSGGGVIDLSNSNYNDDNTNSKGGPPSTVTVVVAAVVSVVICIVTVAATLVIFRRLAKGSGSLWCRSRNNNRNNRHLHHHHHHSNRRRRRRCSWPCMGGEHDDDEDQRGGVGNGGGAACGGYYPYLSSSTTTTTLTPGTPGGGNEPPAVGGGLISGQYCLGSSSSSSNSECQVLRPLMIAPLSAAAQSGGATTIYRATFANGQQAHVIPILNGGGGVQTLGSAATMKNFRPITPSASHIYMEIDPVYNATNSETLSDILVSDLSDDDLHRRHGGGGHNCSSTTTSASSSSEDSSGRSSGRHQQQRFVDHGHVNYHQQQHLAPFHNSLLGDHHQPAAQQQLILNDYDNSSLQHQPVMLINGGGGGGVIDPLPITAANFGGQHLLRLDIGGGSNSNGGHLYPTAVNGRVGGHSSFVSNHQPQQPQSWQQQRQYQRQQHHQSLGFQ